MLDNMCFSFSLFVQAVGDPEVLGIVVVIVRDVIVLIIVDLFFPLSSHSLSIVWSHGQNSQ